MSWSLRGMASQLQLTLPVLVLSAPALSRTILEIFSPPKRAPKRQSSRLRVTQEVTNLRCRTLGFGAPGSPFEMVKDMMLSPYLYILVDFASKFSIPLCPSLTDYLLSVLLAVESIKDKITCHLTLTHHLCYFDSVA